MEQVHKRAIDSICLKLSDKGLKAFELSGLDYSQEVYVARADGDSGATREEK